jgi:hypothetical protein
MDDQTVTQYRPTASEPITEPIYSRINFANIELNKWYYLTVMNLDYIVRPFIENEYGITFAITQMLDRDEPMAEWVNMACVYTVQPADLDGNGTNDMKLYIYMPTN